MIAKKDWFNFYALRKDMLTFFKWNVIFGEELLS